MITYAGRKFLIDPCLADKGTFPPVPSAVNPDRWNPLVDLPVPLEELMAVDSVVVTHLHFDHFDEMARKLLPKSVSLFARNEVEAEDLRSSGFTHVSSLNGEGTLVDGILLTRTEGEHGHGEEVARHYAERHICPEVCGVVFYHPGEPVLYIAGDTVWCTGVQEALDRHQPDVIVLNAGDARFLTGSSIIMGAEDVCRACRGAPRATVIASHMEAVNHAPLTRAELGEFLRRMGVDGQVLIPADGEECTF